MADNFLYLSQEGAQSYFDDSKKRKQVIQQQLQPIEYLDLISPDKEKESSNNDLEDD